MGWQGQTKIFTFSDHNRTRRVLKTKITSCMIFFKKLHVKKTCSFHLSVYVSRIQWNRDNLLLTLLSVETSIFILKDLSFSPYFVLFLFQAFSHMILQAVVCNFYFFKDWPSIFGFYSHFLLNVFYRCTFLL